MRDRVPGEVTSWALHNVGVEEWLVSAVMSGDARILCQKLKIQSMYHTNSVQHFCEFCMYSAHFF